jgi:hypothetical protein
MNELIELTEEEWFEQFKPIPNHIDLNASFNDGENGYMFETYGDEIDFVKEQKINKIWTYGEGDDGGTYIWSGWRVINRLGYFITTVPYDDSKDYQIQISNPDMYVCPNCETEWEDESAYLHYEKFEDLEKCAGCATIEELKEIEEMETHDLGKMGN